MGSRLDGKQASKWAAFCDDLAGTAAIARGGDSIAVLDFLMKGIGLSRAAAALDSGRRRADRSAQSDDLVALRRAAVLHRDLSDFEAWLRSTLTHRDDPEGVELSTVHRVKGMEWDRVVVFGADRGLFPHDLAEDREEERRVFHVAITRGREQVAILADRSRPSSFVTELTGAAQRVDKAPTRATAERMKAGITVSIGDRVRIAGGYAGVADEIEDIGVMVALDDGSSSMLVEWGETVTTAAGSGLLGRPREESIADEKLVARLKEWRKQVAVDNSVPAYVVMSDKTLLAIAAARPGNESQLIMVPGIGPGKLEQYGDDILAICADT
jgi:DNA helicase-2/ATP-dependent DNA helicase PcrA